MSVILANDEAFRPVYHNASLESCYFIFKSIARIAFKGSAYALYLGSALFKMFLELKPFFIISHD